MNSANYNIKTGLAQNNIVAGFESTLSNHYISNKPKLPNRHNIRVVENFDIIDDLDIEDLHPKTEVYYIHYFEGARRCNITRHEVEPLKVRTRKQIESRRSSINGFSNRSRSNLIKKANSINQDTMPKEYVHFGCLTYSEHITEEHAKESKKDLNRYFTRIRKDMKAGKIKDSDGNPVYDIFIIWRAEPHLNIKGGAFGRIHYHLLLAGIEYISYKYLRELWDQVNCVNSPSRVDFEPARSWGDINSYFSKTLGYVSKEMDVFDRLNTGGLTQEQIENAKVEYEKIKNWKIGRHWGIINRKAMNKVINMKSIEVSREEFIKIKRICMNYTIKTQTDKFYNRKKGYGVGWSNEYARTRKQITLNQRWIKRGNRTGNLTIYLKNKTFLDLLKCVRINSIDDAVKLKII